MRNIENPVHGLCDFFSIAVFSEREVLKVIATSQPVITDYETPLYNAISKAQLPNTADSLQKDSSQRHCYLHGCLYLYSATAIFARYLNQIAVDLNIIYPYEIIK